MPRKSRAAIEFEPFTRKPNGPKTSIAPPADIPSSISELMSEIFASQPADHWRSGDEHLVEQYSQAILTCREAHQHLRSEGHVLASGKANPWLLVWEKFNRASVALAARLRLAPQQRHDAKRAARELHLTEYGNPITNWR
jgi:hypothetical protein